MVSMTLGEHLDRTRIPAAGTLWLRIGALLVLVIALVLVLISFLNYSNYRKTCVELSLTRHLVLAQSLRHTIEAGLNIGLRPAENEHLLPAIKEITASHSAIRFVAVVDDSGAMLGDGSLPALTPDAIAHLIAHTDSAAFWQGGDKKTAQIGLVFVNGFDLKIGAVLIGYDVAQIEAAASAMLWKLVTDVLTVLLLMAALTLLAVYALTRRFSHDVAQVGATILGALQASKPAPLPDHIFDHGLAAELNEFVSLSHEVGRTLADLEHGASAPAGMAP